MEPLERRLLVAIQGGLPLVERPYLAVAEALGVSEEEVLRLVAKLLDEGQIRRLAAIPRPRGLGIEANGMSVWDVPDDRAADIGRRMGEMPAVTHCYRRPRHLPHWPYNVFAMVHGRDREDVLASVEHIAQELGLSGVAREVVFSTREFKKSGVRLEAEATVGVED